MKLVIVSLVVCVGAVVGCSSAPEPTATVSESVSGGNEHVRGNSKSGAGPSPLVDHGGDVLTTSNTYAIFWGPLADFPADEVAGVENVLGGFDGSSYLAIANQYMRGGTATTAYKGKTFVSSAPPSHAPKASDLGNEVCSLFGTPDPNGIYFVFTSNLPKVSYCAWHADATCNGVTFQVAYMPNMAGDSGCSPFKVANLKCNGYTEGTQSLLDGMAHEYMEATTDPHIDAWYDKGGQEIGDKCNFVYGACVTLANGTSWQLQEEWSNAGSGCVQQ
jgi:hypothetical protein